VRSLEELAKDAASDADVCASGAVVIDLIAHVQRQAEQIAALTARVEALEASEAERAIDRMVARRTGPGRPMRGAGHVQTPAKLDEAPEPAACRLCASTEAPLDTDGACASPVHCLARRMRAGLPDPTVTAAPATASDDYEARAREWLRDYDGAESVEHLSALLRTVADEARREERAACEAVCRKAADEHYSMRAASVCAAMRAVDKVLDEGGGR